MRRLFLMLAALACPALAWADPLWVALSSTGELLSSLDGRQWAVFRRPTPEAGGTPRGLALAYGGGGFVATGERDGAGWVLSSPRGRQWTEEAILGGPIAVVAYGRDRFIAAQAEKLLVCTDGAHFEPAAPLPMPKWFQLEGLVAGDTEAGFRFLLHARDSSTAKPSAWMALTAQGEALERHEAVEVNYRSVAYGSGHFVRATGEAWVESSHDGESWQRHPLTQLARYVQVVWDGQLFRALAAPEREGLSEVPSVWSSPDGLHWTATELHPPGEVLAAHHAGGALARGPKERIFHTADWLTWSPIAIAGDPPTGEVRAAVYRPE